MNNQSPLCPHCKRVLDKSHGNNIYHPACAYEVKKLRSITQYAKDRGKINPYWYNERILKNMYRMFGEDTEIDPDLLENSGFDFDLFREEITRGQNKFFVMNTLGYSLLKNKKIILWKI